MEREEVSGLSCNMGRGETVHPWGSQSGGSQGLGRDSQRGQWPERDMESRDMCPELANDSNILFCFLSRVFSWAHGPSRLSVNPSRLSVTTRLSLVEETCTRVLWGSPWPLDGERLWSSSAQHGSGHRWSLPSTRSKTKTPPPPSPRVLSAHTQFS